ncbi:MAG: hypothetical protein KC492_21785, partial [Myxococcales bacterium]|nr:hypothetical protein [Myxococcales bacterium]
IYSQLRVEWPLRPANYEARSSAQARNPSDAESLSFDPTWPLAVGVSLPVLSPLHLGLRMGAGELLRVRGGPSIAFFETAAVPRAVLPVYQRQDGRREFAFAFSMPLALLLPVYVSEATAGRAVTRETRASIGFSVGWQLECLFRWGHSVLNFGPLFAQRWVSYSETSRMKTQAVQVTQSYRAHYSLFGLHVGYGWNF